jgi:hypothetical protein
MNKSIDSNYLTTSSESQIKIPDEPIRKTEDEKYTKGKPHRITIVAKISHDKDTTSKN